MATYTLNSTLVDDPLYPQIGSQELAPGDTIVNNVYYTSGTGVSIVSETGGYPVLGHNQATNSSGYTTFSYTATTADASSSLYFYYWGANGNPYYNNITSYRGKVLITVTAGPVCSGTASGNISVSTATTAAATTIATISGVTAGPNCALYTRATESGAYSQGNYGPWSAGVTHGVVRGNAYIFEAVNAGLIGNIVSSYPTIIGYLPTDLTVGVGTANVVGDNETGTWTQTVTGIDAGGWYNYRVYTSVPPLSPLSEENHPYLNTRVGDDTIENDKNSNTPEVGETITYNLWGARTTASGGSGIFTITNPVASFTVTRAEGTHSEGDPADGTYFDNDLSTGAIHTVTLSSLTQNWYYNISASSANITTPLSTWNTATTKTVTDASASIPSGTNVTTTPYYLWRSENANGSSPEYTEQTYNRSLANYDRFSFSDSTVTLADTDTTFTQTINNTIDGHTYYIYSGSSIVGTGIATGTTLAIGCTEVGVPNPGDEVTHTLKTLSPANAVPTSAYSTGTTYTVTRTGTGSGSGEGADPSPYGLEVFNAAGTTKLYDTTSRGGRIMASGTIPSSGTLAYEASQTINVSGLVNSTDYNITIVPLHGGTGSGLAGYAGYIFDLTKSNGSFTITNNSGIANAYYYYVIKSGGS